MSNLRMVGALLVLAGVAGLSVDAPFSAMSGSPEPPSSLSSATWYPEGVLPVSAEPPGPGHELVAMHNERTMAEAATQAPSGADEWSETWDWPEDDEEAED